MRASSFVAVRLLRLILFAGVSLAVSTFISDARATQTSKPGSQAAGAARIEFWNRVIAFQRGSLAGVGAQDRANHAIERLRALPLNVSPTEISLRPIKIENQDGEGLFCRGQLLFFLGTNDLDKESGETLEQASQSALRNLNDVLQAKVEERSWPVIRAGILFTVVGLLLILFLCSVLWKMSSRLLSYVRSREDSLPIKIRIFGFDFLPYIAAATRSLLRTLTWILTLVAFYLWVTLSLRQFPYTEPWGNQSGSFVLRLLRDLATAAVYAVPGLLAIFFIFLITRWVTRLMHAVFEQLATGKIRLSWMDPDVARATQRIFVAIVWIFAVIVAYPYIPGSQTDAFKGISVLVGLIVSLGSTGIINQIMSGLFVVYSKALKTGEWVKVNDTEGEVLEVGLLAAKVRTIEGQEVTIPNSVLVGTSTKNYTRLGMVISCTVTIGYNVPWRQVHALLLRAVHRAPNIRKDPEPYVVQRALSDFYVEYTLIAQLEEEQHRIESLSVLNSQIQDAFNEFGVQIMSPHYFAQPVSNVIVPPTEWNAPPAEPKS